MLPHCLKSSALLILTLALSVSANKLNEQVTVFECPNSKNSYYPHPEDCSSFYYCNDGVSSQRRCPDGLNFNPESIQCDWPNNVICHINEVTPDPALLGVTIIDPNPDYNCTANGAFPHPVNCELFYTCWEDIAVLNACTEEQLFDLRYDGCNWANLTACQDRERPEGYPGTITPPPPPTTTGPSTTTADPGNQTTTTGEPDAGYNCTENGAFAHPIYCEKYYTCWEGEDVLHTCENEYLFDLIYLGCNLPEYTACQDRIRPPGAPGTITPPPGNTTSTTRRPGAFECPEIEGIFPDPEDCAGFYQCAEWIDYHYDCPRPLLYHPVKQSCDHPINVDCGDRPRP